MSIAALAARPPSLPAASELTAAPSAAIALPQAQQSLAVSPERQLSLPRDSFMEVAPRGDKFLPDLCEPLSRRNLPQSPGELGTNLTPPDLSTQPVDGPNGTEKLASLLSHLIEALGGAPVQGPGGPNSEGPGSCGPGGGASGGKACGGGAPGAGGPGAGEGLSSLDGVVQQLTQAVESLAALAQGVAVTGNTL
ncbi:hypothetical protein SAMN05444354_12743 [Stigmatella aurantiaca]|uniref:Uncharacterized protein n=1 Tax=Stigmatella aurantiaca TaxID=41 RepID=A0A1H8CQL9_STIAU|nr:hypothetical protein [Stigmatella aurantiaca]SEM97325.1 hypothetical protein SAMN05444354_12743 [Stigmatella aurantiaca]